MATVAPASSIDQRIQATAGCSVCSGAAPIFGSRASRRRPKEGRAPFARTAVVTSAYDVGAIADAGFRDHDPWRCRIDLDLPPKVRDMDAKVLLRTAELATPDGVEDLLVGEGAAARADERTENLPFDRCEMNLPAVALDAACHGIDTEPVNCHWRGRRRRAGSCAPELRPRPPRPLAPARREKHIDLIGPWIDEIETHAPVRRLADRCRNRTVRDIPARRQYHRVRRPPERAIPHEQVTVEPIARAVGVCLVHT